MRIHWNQDCWISLYTVTKTPVYAAVRLADVIILSSTHTHTHTHAYIQLLACLQVDILHCKYRCILALGVELSVRLAASKQVKNAAERLKRTKEQTIYGSKSRKQLREEEDQAVCMCVCVCKALRVWVGRRRRSEIPVWNSRLRIATVVNSIFFNGCERDIGPAFESPTANSNAKSFMYMYVCVHVMWK
jgi:hypothetical protein